MSFGAEGNAGQVEMWNGASGERWATDQARYDAMLASFGEVLADTAAIAGGEAVLDVGCGCGVTTLAAARASGTGPVLGVDLSAPMLAVARARAAEAGLGNARFEQADVQVHPFPEAGFDVVLSRFGVMFFDDPPAAFANLARSLRPGGRLAFVCWQGFSDNEWMVVPASAALAHVPPPEFGEPDAPGPFSLADPERLRALLGDAGFSAIDVTDVRRPMLMAGGGDVDQVVEFFRRDNIGRRLLDGVDPVVVERALGAVREALAPYATDAGVELTGAAWAVTARR